MLKKGKYMMFDIKGKLLRLQINDDLGILREKESKLM